MKAHALGLPAQMGIGFALGSILGLIFQFGLGHFLD